VVSGEPSSHAFWRPVRIAAVPGPSLPMLADVVAGVRRAMTERGHSWTDEPDDRIDAFVTTARVHEPIAWRTSPLFTGRKRYGLSGKPATYTFVHVTQSQLDHMLRTFDKALQKSSPRPEDFDFPGLSTNAWQVLSDQGRRGGPMMCVGRLLQAQSKSLRVVMVVGDDRPVAAHLFDLAGAFPRIDAATDRGFFTEIGLRIATHLSTREVTNHRVAGPAVSRETWQRSPAPAAMVRASRELGARQFFTRMVRIADLVDVPAITGTIAQQYSEGCLGTWDPTIGAQVVTVTGSQHPVVKGSLQEDDLAVITGVLPDGTGASVRLVEGLRNDPPSSEAVEFEAIDRRLPRRADGTPMVRSKLHGHRGVTSFDPRTVEYVPLDAPYFDYLVSCSTEAQANGVEAAFARSQALRDPNDPRTVVFTILPGHGLLMAEKWVTGREPFDVLLAAMDEGRLELSQGVPQGRMRYVPAGDRMVLAVDGDEAPRATRRAQRAHTADA